MESLRMRFRSFAPLLLINQPAMNEIEACIVLNMLPRIGPIRFRELMRTFGKATDVLRTDVEALSSVKGISRKLALEISSWERSVDVQKEIQLVNDAGVKAIIQADESYPPLLREIHDPPIVLYVWGELTEQVCQNALGIVGSRQPSHYGTEITKKLAYQLAYAGITVISGLARGIDTCAHQGALAAQGKTIAVLGCGLSTIYPPENYSLAEKIAETGAVISEFPMFTKPDRQTFPMRNRIISGCCQGILVAEAGVNSGALISANQALEQGRTVFAVPGQIDRPNSYGANRLIQQGAKLVMSAEDVVTELGLLVPAENNSIPTSTPSAVPRALNEIEAKVFQAIHADETPIDLIVLNSALPTSEVASTLFTLEMKKIIKQLPGKHYIRLS